MHAPREWLNYDASPRLQISAWPLIGGSLSRIRAPFPDNAQWGDIVKGLALPDSSCRGVYASHVIEHLSLADARTALRNVYHLLQPEGVFRLVVPDLDRMARDYVNDPNENACHEFMTRSMLGWETKPRNLAEYVRLWWGNSKHLWMWDDKALCYELSVLGFIDVRRAAFGDSNDARFDEVEEQARWRDCLGIEGRKPGAQG